VRKWQRGGKWIVIAGACMAVGACAGWPGTDRPVPAAPSGGVTYCAVATPFYWSSADTRKTKEQADRINRVGKALCGWKGK